MIVFAAMLAAGVLAELIAVLAAPFGHQDDAGFHVEQRKAGEEDSRQAANAS